MVRVGCDVSAQLSSAQLREVYDISGFRCVLRGTQRGVEGGLMFRDV